MSEFSRVTVEEYLPIIKSIFASFEVQDRYNDDMEKFNALRVNYLEKDFGSSRLLHAMKLIGVWLNGTKFQVNVFQFIKNDPEAKWSEMLNVIHAKFMEYANDLPIIVLTLTSSGRITREVNGIVLTHDFVGEKIKAQILTWLPNDGSYLKTEKLRVLVGSKSVQSLSKMINAINGNTTSKLGLPKNKALIESKRGSGYRINPIYNLVRIH